MKKRYNIILGALLSMTIGSCQKYLDIMPDDVVTVNSMFADRYTVERYLATCYMGLPNAADDNANPGILGAMEMVYNTSQDWSNARGMQLARGLNSSTVNIIDHWQNGMYAKIRICNDFLAGINTCDDLTTAEKSRMIAEVKLLKAYMHFYLLRYYGPICLLKTNSPVNQATENTYSHREKIDDCYAYVLELLQEVIDSNALPVTIQNRVTELGRFTSPVAYTLKAKVLLYWASPLFNGNTEYNSFMNHDNEPFFNQNREETRWEKAAKACDDAILECGKAGIRLYKISDYLSTRPLSAQIKQVNMLRSVVSERWNCEIIWGNSVYAVGEDLQRKSSAVLVAAEGYMMPQTLSVPFSSVDKFYTKNGLPLTHDKDVNLANQHTVYKYSKGEDFPFDYNYNKRYIAMDESTAGMNYDREPRFYSTLGFDRGVWYGNSFTDPDGDASVEPPRFIFPKNHYGESASVYNATHYNATGYWPKKLVSLTSSFTSIRDFKTVSYPYPEMRYADLLLMAAEAWNEVEGATSKVRGYIDEIRERAGLEGIKESYQKYALAGFKNFPDDKANMREIIRRERFIELACEGSYFWDIRRWKIAREELNRSIQGWNVLGGDNAAEVYYTPTLLYVQSFSFRDYFAPIPEQDIVRNPLLKQNPGW